MSSLEKYIPADNLQTGIVPCRNGRPKRDAIILHGMLSNPAKMVKLRTALEKRGCYRKVYIPTLESGFNKYIPKIMQRIVAYRHLVPLIIKALENKTISAPFDIIGHSNGGYAAIHLIEALPEGLINNIITISTPRGFWGLNPDKSKINELIHIYGGRDFLNDIRNTGIIALAAGSALFGDTNTFYKTLSVGAALQAEKFNPTADALFFRFPDEGHSSIHKYAFENGVADLLAFITSRSNAKVFVDENGIIHIHEWCCREHKGKKFFRVDTNTQKHFDVCDGLHIDGMKSYPDDIYHNSFILGHLLKIVEYPVIKQNLNIEEKRVNKQLGISMKQNKKLKSEIKQLSVELLVLQSKLIGLGINYEFRNKDINNYLNQNKEERKLA